MINKKNLWFLTLFSLVLVLSVYYITMPSELLTTNNGEIVNPSAEVSIEEANIIETLKQEDNNNNEENKDTLKDILPKDEEANNS